MIAGAGGFGRGVFSWLTSSCAHRRDNDVESVVFIDDSAKREAPAEIVSSIEGYSPREDDYVICAVGQPALRRTLVDALWAKGARFHTFVDDRAVVAESVKLSDGAVVCPGVVISADAQLGEHVHINFNSSVGHDVRLGAFSTLSPSVNIMGEVVVGESVFFGGSAVVLPRLCVAAGAVIGAGAVVHKTVSTAATVVGNPARELRPEGVTLG